MSEGIPFINYPKLVHVMKMRFSIDFFFFISTQKTFNLVLGSTPPLSTVVDYKPEKWLAVDYLFDKLPAVETIE